MPGTNALVLVPAPHRANFIDAGWKQQRRLDDVNRALDVMISGRCPHTAGTEKQMVIALWRGHETIETTQANLHAHLALKEAALGKLKPYECGKPARLRPNDRLL